MHRKKALCGLLIAVLLLTAVCVPAAAAVSDEETARANLETVITYLKANGVKDGATYSETFVNFNYMSEYSITYDEANNRMVFAGATPSFRTALDFDLATLIVDNHVRVFYYPDPADTSRYAVFSTTEYESKRFLEFDNSLNYTLEENRTGLDIDDALVTKMGRYMHGLTLQSTSVYLFGRFGLCPSYIGISGYAMVAPDKFDGKTTGKNGLIYENEVFKYYEYDYHLTIKYGFVDYDGGRFLVANGILAPLNGLVNDPNGTAGDWYFCAEGRIVSDHSGFCEYDGAWFLVRNGKLDNTATGFYEYDGGLFYMAEGRLLKEASGLLQDPTTGEWYFCADGQAQTQYTGLALYDDAWFYVVSGKLAEDYTGTVEYDGGTFNVVNGMVQ